MARADSDLVPSGPGGRGVEVLDELVAESDAMRMLVAKAKVAAKSDADVLPG